jgi:hypothetical protein
MKKVILAMLVVFCVIGPIAAQEIKIGDGTLTIGGKISTGIEVTFDDADNDEGKVRMYNDDDSGQELRGELTTTYTNGDVGFTTRFRATQGQLGQNAVVGLRFAYGWINLFDGHFRPVGGYVDNNVWGTKGDLDVDVAGAGLRLEFKPIAGLNFGAFLRVPGQVSNDDEVNIDTVHNIEQFMKATALGLGYENSAFYLRLQYLIDRKAEENNDPDGQLDFGIGFTGLPALEAHAEGRITKLDDFDTGNADFRQTVGYTISEALPLTIKLNVKEVLYGEDTKDTWLGFNPSVSYAVSNALSVGLAGGYGFGYNTKDYEYDIYVKPNLSFNFGNGLTTKLWYKFDVSKEDASNTDPVNASTIQLDFVWSF